MTCFFQLEMIDMVGFVCITGFRSQRAVYQRSVVEINTKWHSGYDIEIVTAGLVIGVELRHENSETDPLANTLTRTQARCEILTRTKHPRRTQ